MSFPYNDKNWRCVADFILSNRDSADRILSPDDFYWVFDSIFRYQNTFIRPNATYDWMVFHKGHLDQLNPQVIKILLTNSFVVLANEVFVVYGNKPYLKSVSDANLDVQPFLRALPKLRSASAEATLAEAAAQKGLPPCYASSLVPADHVLPDQGILKKLSMLSPQEFMASMNDFYLAGGYKYVTLRDKTYYAEIDQFINDYIGNAHNLDVLDVCCGNNRLEKLLTKAAKITGVDISSVAIEQAQQSTDDSRFEFKTGDAHQLDCEDKSYDLVLFVDAIEHVIDIAKVFKEISRVTKIGGRVFLTAANRNSLNQKISRKMGTGEFVTNYQHIREFDFHELEVMLQSYGFKITQSDGLFLYPYWGVPGVDQYVRSITDNDTEIVELTRKLGRLVGPEHAYAFVILAVKAD